MKFLLFISFIGFLTVGLSGQQSSHLSEQNASTQNTLFQTFLKYDNSNVEVSLPFVGDYHFTDYSFVEEKESFRKYNYFLSSIRLKQAYFLLPSNSNFNIGLSAGLQMRVWNKRRAPLRSNYEWRASHAIKTPSYRIGIQYDRLIDQKVTNRGQDFRYFTISFSHHSNGQDGPTLVSQDSTLLLPDDYKYNIDNGDFSANQITFKYSTFTSKEQKAHSASYWLKLDGLGSGNFDHDDLYKYVVGMEQNLFFIADDMNIRGFNPRHELYFSICAGMSSFETISFAKSINYQIKYRYPIPKLNSLGLFITYGYYGQDNYNIFLNDHYHYMKIGLSLKNNIYN